MAQLVCLDGIVLASHEDYSLDVPINKYPAGSVIIPWLSGVDTLEAVPDMPLPTEDDLERPDGLAEHAAKYRWAGHKIAPVPRTEKQLRAYAASRRYYTSIAGLEVDGVRYATDEASADRMAAKAAKAARLSDDALITWKAAGGPVMLDSKAFKAAAERVDAYRQSCFDAEGKADAGIEDGSVKTMADIDGFFEAIVP